MKRCGRRSFSNCMLLPEMSRMRNLTFNSGIKYTIVFYRDFFRGNVSVAIVLLPNEIILLQEKL